MTDDLTTIRVMTLNVFGHHGGWPARRPVLQDGFAALRPDLVALQETIVGDGQDQVRDLLGDEYLIVHQRGRSADHCGASFASRLPFTLVREYDLPRSERMDPNALWIGSMAMYAIETAAPLLFVHVKPPGLRPQEPERLEQAVATARIIEELVADRPAHVIVAGDFDAIPEAACMRFWRGLHPHDGTSVCYEDAWAAIHPNVWGETFTNRNPLVAAGEMPFDRGRRIDHILVRCGTHGPTMQIQDCQRVLDSPVNGVWPSDHFGLIADFGIPARGAPGIGL